MKRGTKGITLIALVITIIVLLILAGISINMLTGQNGLLDKTQEAQEANRMAKAKEKVELAIFESWDEKGEFNREQFKEEIEKEGGSILEEKETTITVQMDIYECIVDVEAGKIIEVKVGSTSIEYEVTPDENVQAPSRTIKVKAKSFKNPIVSIKMPDNTIIDGGEASFEATKDGDYTFVIIDSTGNEIEKTVTISKVVPSVELFNSDKQYSLLGGWDFTTHNRAMADEYQLYKLHIWALATGHSASNAIATSKNNLNYPYYGTLNFKVINGYFPKDINFGYMFVKIGSWESGRLQVKDFNTPVSLHVRSNFWEVAVWRLLLGRIEWGWLC